MCKSSLRININIKWGMSVLSRQVYWAARTNYPENTRCSPNDGTMLAHRLRRWPSIVPSLGEHFVFAVGNNPEGLLSCWLWINRQSGHGSLQSASYSRTVELKGWIFHSTKWEIHPFNTTGTICHTERHPCVQFFKPSQNIPISLVDITVSANEGRFSHLLGNK